MPKAPKGKSQVKKARENASFREALGLSTSEADIQRFIEIKKTLRELIKHHYDPYLSHGEQPDAKRTAFAAQVSTTMPMLYATENARKETASYVTRHFATTSWLLRKRKSAPPEAACERAICEGENSDNIQDGILGVLHHRRTSCSREVQRDLSADGAFSQTEGSSNKNNGIMLDEDEDEDVGNPEKVPSRSPRSRPRKNESTRVEGTDVLQEHASRNDTEALTSPARMPSPSSDRPPSYSPEIDNHIHKFLCSCKPNLEHLLPVFDCIGLQKRADLEGVLDWPVKERVSWLMELSKEEWGISRMNVKSLSLAFEVAQQYEATKIYR